MFTYASRWTLNQRKEQYLFLVTGLNGQAVARDHFHSSNFKNLRMKKRRKKPTTKQNKNHQENATC
jgi:hypothetical protein